DPAIDTKALVRTKATLQLETAAGEPRLVHGRLASVVQLDTDGDLTSYRAELVPPVWFLSLVRDSRVFADLPVDGIVRAIFDEAGMASGSDYEFALQGSYAPQRWTAQYRESSLDFVSRLLEEAGIFYFFVHDDGGGKMMLTDANGTAVYPPGTKPVRMAPVGGTAVLETDIVSHLFRERRARAGKITLADYNFRTPSSRLLATLAGEDPEEVYDYPARFRDRQQGDQLARVRLEEQEALNVTVRGSGAIRTIRAGGRFDLVEHYHDEFNTGYLALRVSLSARITGLRSGEDPTFHFGTEFSAIPFDVPYRPPRVTPAPTVPGIQTAVVGPAPGGEEIMVDQYGRIPIQYHWDRRNKDASKPSAWARVAQAWAGKTWGSIAIPRIGQEVVVEFLEGDPDRPLVTGSVYNGEQMPPYSLPGNQTRSTTKSRSSPGGGPSNFNEIRLEDKKGSEEIYIHAEKDKVVLVENDRRESVGHDETIEIGHDRRETVGNDETIEVRQHRSATVGGNETISVGGDQSVSVGGNQRLTVGGNNTVGVSGDQAVTVEKNRTLTVSNRESIAVGGDRATEVGKNDRTNVAQNRSTSVGKNEDLQVAKKMVLNVGDELTIKVGDASIVMKKNGEIAIKGKDITINASGKLNAKASGNVVIKGSKVEAN
ncbi:MAG TPA: type VI secretion system tip protein TssI/VgrG, partial [Acidimicrobiales bacterium]|nr:type VI secretion system tip protein TssI/VgrG [Acidimicrobiales bacterium]